MGLRELNSKNQLGPWDFLVAILVIAYSLRPKKSDVIYFQASCLTVRLIQIFCVNLNKTDG